LVSRSIEIDFVVEMDVPDEEIITRMSGRRMHPGSGRNYHIEFNPPKEADIDDETGEPLVQREDDKPETVKDRLQVYNNQTSPLIQFYSEKTESISYIKVSGSSSPEEVSRNILDQIRQS
jgi:adenylate kinase